MISIHREMMLYKEKKPVVITVPVNLRQYFLRNVPGTFLEISGWPIGFRKEKKTWRISSLH